MPERSSVCQETLVAAPHAVTTIFIWKFALKTPAQLPTATMLSIPFLFSPVTFKVGCREADGHAKEPLINLTLYTEMQRNANNGADAPVIVNQLRKFPSQNKLHFALVTRASSSKKRKTKLHFE
jgi:hypothetical protein